MLDSSFFNRPTLEVARDLLGKSIVRDGIKAVIVETEAYIGPIDKGCHAYHFRKTSRNEVMFQQYGIAYIYMVYGMYHCLNFVTEEKGMPCAVLVRAVMVTDGHQQASLNRYAKDFSTLSSYEQKNFSNGPGKVCMLLNLTRKQNGLSLQSDELSVDETGINDFDIVTAKRVNIDYAEEAKDFPWRFYISGNKNVSVK